MALKKRALKVFFSVCFSGIIILCLFLIIRNVNFNKKKEKELLNIADNIVNENIVKENECNNLQNISENEIFSVEKLENDNNIVGKIIIEKIGVSAPIMDGVDQETLKVAVGHFSNSGYWYRQRMSCFS